METRVNEEMALRCQNSVILKENNLQQQHKNESTFDSLMFSTTNNLSTQSNKDSNFNLSSSLVFNQSSNSCTVENLNKVINFFFV